MFYSLYLYIVRRLAEKRGARLKSGTLMKYRIFCGLIGVSLTLPSFYLCSHCVGNSDFVMEGKGEAWNA